MPDSPAKAVSPWRGILPAVWTPANAGGRLLAKGLREHVAWMARQGVHGFMALGSTGEFLFLSTADRQRALEAILAGAGSRPVMANVSDVRPGVVAELGRHAHQAGAAAVAVLAPHFYPLSQDDLVEFFVRAGEAAGLPLVLYNFPERTGNRIALETIAAVARRVPVAAVKQSGAEFNYHAPLAKLGAQKGFVLLTGSDTDLPAAMRLGARGCVSGLANAVPEILCALFAAVEGGRSEAAARQAERMRALGALMDAIEFPLNVAAAIEARGQPVGPPKRLLAASTQARYRRLVREIARLFAAWELC